jgi:hypothetical protein
MPTISQLNRFLGAPSNDRMLTRVADASEIPKTIQVPALSPSRQKTSLLSRIDTIGMTFAIHRTRRDCYRGQQPALQALRDETRYRLSMEVCMP